MTLQVSGLKEAVEVRGTSPVVDVRSSAAPNNLSTEVLELIPYGSRFGPDAVILSPGVNPNTLSAFGSAGESSNAWMIDGVDVSDPRGGTQWLFANYNWFQEVQVAALGAPAEYGGFTGVASNSLIRSGGNRFSGLFETLYQNKDMTADNISDEVLALNDASRQTSSITSPTARRRSAGRSKRDKIWFFTSFQCYQPKESPSGYPPPGTENVGRTQYPEGIIAAFHLQADVPAWDLRPAHRVHRSTTTTRWKARGAASNVAPVATRKQTESGDCLECQLQQGPQQLERLGRSLRRIRWLLRAGTVQRSRHDGVVRRGHRFLFGQQLLLLEVRPEAAPGQRQPDQARVRVRRAAQPEVRSRVRAQLRQDRSRISGRRLRPCLLGSADLRVSWR